MKLLVTDRRLIGSEVCSYFAGQGMKSMGWIITNAVFSGIKGIPDESSPSRGCTTRFQHHELDIRNRQGVLELIKKIRPNAVVHTAAQPL